MSTPPALAVGPAAAPAAPPAPVERRCPNCGAPAPGRFCPECGQEQNDLRPTVREIARSFVEDHLGYDSKSWRTLWVLVRHPGGLTAEYLAGRRVRYLRPLRLYLTASLLFFVAVSLPGVRSPFEGIVQIGTGPSSQGFSVGPGAPPAADPNAPPIPPGERSWIVRQIAKASASMGTAEAGRYLTRVVQRSVSNAMFLLLPVFALLLHVLHRRSGGWHYAEHFVFALHLHALIFLALLAALPIPAGVRAAALLVVVPLYTLLAMRRVYAQPWMRTVAKFVALSAAYYVALMLTTLVIVLASLARF